MCSPCIVQQLLYFGKAPQSKITNTLPFCNIKIPKPPYISSLKIIGFLHFFKFLGPSEKNLQSLMITLYNYTKNYVNYNNFDNHHNYNNNYNYTHYNNNNNNNNHYHCNQIHNHHSYNYSNK